jgi:hypothetical protein
MGNRRVDEGCNSFIGMMLAMAKRRPYGGRRSKGPRDLMATRLPIEEADRIRDLAEERGMTNTDFLAELLRIGLRHLDELQATQKELPLSKAS